MTADAVPATCGLATYLAAREAGYVFIVEENQQRLHARLAALPWPQATHHASTGIGHGRLEQRTIEVLPTPHDLDFPAAATVLQATSAATNRGTRRTTPSTASPT
ncbi:hypothetical protein VSH64_38560 [Amycolatopsis rhabdoformis]|uniref:Uncharacterized protein n=1 Tax=Amycolatopsis rhabdoformis TaxID=1448059 RepID=A0ABZ1I4B2_9PSEU|nr:hypothetical protein [Amycolatopsis rhabdoformis]WSE28683.1 hypothetical protein VSH64_38560 [Amycolatopsis rhabdoformis]